MQNSVLIDIHKVTKHYGIHQALKGVSLSLHAGEIVSLLGVNGAGKTTLSSIVATLKPPTSGDVLFKGCSIYADVPAYRRMIGVCPQKPNLHPQLTMRDNLESTGRYYGLNDVQIAERISELHEHLGIGQYLNSFSSALSGGWKQRYLIARTLMHKPLFVIFDEPTVALDPDVRRQLWDYIKYLRAQGMCVLLTTHYIDEAEYLSDRVCVLDKGEIKLIDTPANLMKSFQKQKLEDVFIHLVQESREG